MIYKTDGAADPRQPAHSLLATNLNHNQMPRYHDFEAIEAKNEVEKN